MLNVFPVYSTEGAVRVLFGCVFCFNGMYHRVSGKIRLLGNFECLHILRSPSGCVNNLRQSSFSNNVSVSPCFPESLGYSRSFGYRKINVLQKFYGDMDAWRHLGQTFSS